MQRERHYSSALQIMARAVRDLEAKVPLPLKVPYKTSFVFRYIEKTALQAIVQKLARVVSTLSGAHLLMSHGFVQEQAALQRILQELHEDITFLAYSTVFNDFTPLHKEFLDAFYAEEFDADTALASTQKRPTVSRAKIQAYIVRKEGPDLDPSTGLEIARTITKTYSGYVHAASPQIMDMYVGDPPRFHVEGLLSSHRHSEYRQDLWNYFYRSILSFGVAAEAFDYQALSAEIETLAVKFEEAAGKSYSGRPPQ